MPDNELKIKLQVQNKKANNQLKQTSNSIKDVENKAKGSEKELNRMRVATAGLRRSMGALRNNLLLVTFAFGGVFAAISKSVKAAGEQELAEKKLSTALGRTSKQLLDQASALQQVTAFGDENIIQAQALIAAFTDDEEAIKKATEATLDLASAKGMDLFSAADLVAKTLGSSTNAMSRYGIEVTGAVGSTERLNSLTQNIANTFGGQAQAQANTMTGQFTQMANAIGDTAEAFGRLLFPILRPAARMLKAVAEGTTAVLNAFEKAVNRDDYFEVLNNMDLKTAEFKENIKGLGAVELLLLARRFNEVKHSMNMGLEEQVIYQENLLALNEAMAKNVDLQNLQKSNYVDLASISASVFIPNLKEINKQEEKGLSIDEAIAQAKEERRVAEMNLGQATAVAFQQFKGGALIAARLQQSLATINAFSTITKIMADPKLLFPTNMIMAATAGVTAFNQVAQIEKSIGGMKFAETGMNEIVTKPTLIMAGENGSESVQVTPLDTNKNINGVQGSSVTVNVSGNVMTQDFVEGELADSIKNAIRRGSDFGIS